MEFSYDEEVVFERLVMDGSDGGKDEKRAMEGVVMEEERMRGVTMEGRIVQGMEGWQ